MITIASIDWNKMFVPHTSIPEIILRGSLMYLGIFFVLRVFRRAAGTLGTADLLLVVLIADAAQNAMSAEYQSLTEGVVLVVTIIAWNFLLDWMEFRFEWAHRILQPRPVMLVRNGRIVHHNLRSAMMTVDELHQQLRQHGLDKVSDVKSCQMESDGKLSVIKYERETEQGPPHRGT